MSYQELAELMFPDISEGPDFYENKYPVRELNSGQIVSRIGPSPTGFVHLGNLYNAIICERLVRQTKGVFILRIEDTDSKREVAGAVDMLIDYMDYYGIKFDEGAIVNGDCGEYGPYRQRQRKKIYQAYAKHLVKQGMAYPCFCTEEKLDEIREMQRKEKTNIGYYGTWAEDRNLPFSEAKELIEKGVPFATRLRAPADRGGVVYLDDGIKGKIQFPENTMDFILLKSDGIPTYHFAHVIDDHLMRTTHVIRGEEWLSSVPMHLQLYKYLNFDPPKYFHTAQLMKMEGNSKRKLSKRKDPELALSYYKQKGYLPEVIWHYFLTILNSNYEEWYETSNKGYQEFKFSVDKLSKSGVLFDLAKLDSISKDILSRKEASYIYGELIKWAKEYDAPFYQTLVESPDYSIAVLNIGKKAKHPRKDYANWSEAKKHLACFFDNTFGFGTPFPEMVEKSKCKQILEEYISIYDINDDAKVWYDKVKCLAEKFNFATQIKEYKRNPELYIGNMVDFTNILRVALMGKMSAPDIWEVSKVFGKERVLLRINRAIEILSKES